MRSIRIQRAVIVLLPFLFAGCFFNLSEQEDFQSWYYGDPGLAGALGEADCDRYADNIQGRRHPYYLHFRTPEVFWQPQGGAHYPERTTAERRASPYDPAPPTCEKVVRGWETFRFDAVDAGLVDMIAPYRKPSAVSDYGTAPARRNLAYAKGVVYNTGLAAAMKAPVYIVHDILKTLYIPVAGAYYLLKPDRPPEIPLDNDERPGASSPDHLRPDERAEFQRSVGVAAPEQAPLVLPPEEMNGGPAVGADAPSPIRVETEEEEEEFTATQDGAVPEAAAGDERTEERVLEGATGTPPAAGDLPVEGGAVVPDSAARAADAAEPENRTENQVAGDQETIPSAAAEPEADISAYEDSTAEEDMDPSAAQEPESAATPAAASGMEDGADEDVPAALPLPGRQTDFEPQGADPATGPVMPQDEAASAAENWPAEAPPGGFAEEDLLKTPPSEVDVIDGAPDPSGEAPAMPADAPPPPVVGGPPEKSTVAAATSPALEPIPWKRLSKRNLRKKAAFIGFFSRAVNVDENTKAYLRDRLWPEFKEQCKDNLTLVRQGDPDYPAALNALMRDPYGHLNSFELTTVARFNGLNAIVSGTIIDIRISRELSGILWYKSAEGQLRITILAEVYDAETGTKLLDRIYIHEEEVEELEPGSGDKPRGEDQPALEEALQSIAEDMGDDVCDVLEDQPWRFFVAGIDGDRITLSAGESAGLKAGNVLGVYNSQIIDGLNNQQFFLTGEKVGRIQIINLAGGRSEALLIEGRGLRDYSVAMPE